MPCTNSWQGVLHLIHTCRLWKFEDSCNCLQIPAVYLQPKTYNTRFRRKLGTVSRNVQFTPSNQTLQNCLSRRPCELDVGPRTCSDCRRLSSHRPTRPDSFFPRDAMLARVLAIALCLSVCVCLSGVGVLSKRMNGLIWFLAWRLFFDQSYTVF